MEDVSSRDCHEGRVQEEMERRSSSGPFAVHFAARDEFRPLLDRLEGVHPPQAPVHASPFVDALLFPHP